MKSINLLTKLYQEILIKTENINENQDILKLNKEKDLRGNLFALEAIFRLHLKQAKLSSKEEDSLNQELIKAKKLEDLIGKLDLNQQVGKEQYQITDKDIIKVIQKEWNKEQTDTSLKNLSSVNWVEPDTKDFLKLLKKEIKRTRKKTKKLAPLILKDEYSYYELEEGFHEWRRAIRWISIIILSYKDFFSFEVDEKDKYSDLYSLRNKVFTTLNGDESSHKVDENAFLQLSSYISRIGDIKDEAENLYYQTGDCSKYVSAMQDIFNEFRENKVLKKLF